MLNTCRSHRQPPISSRICNIQIDSFHEKLSKFFFPCYKRIPSKYLSISVNFNQFVLPREREFHFLGLGMSQKCLQGFCKLFIHRVKFILKNLYEYHYSYLNQGHNIAPILLAYFSLGLVYELLPFLGLFLMRFFLS